MTGVPATGFSRPLTQPPQPPTGAVQTRRPCNSSQFPGRWANVSRNGPPTDFDGHDRGRTFDKGIHYNPQDVIVSLLVFGRLRHAGRHGSHQPVAQQDSQKSTDQRGRNLMSDLLGRPAERAHRDYYKRRHKGVGFLVMGLRRSRGGFAAADLRLRKPWTFASIPKRTGMPSTSYSRFAAT